MDILAKELITSFKKDYPHNPLVVFGEDKTYGTIPGWVSTSSYALNWIATKYLNRGLPTGRTVVIVGDPSTGKTAITLSCMRDPSIDLIIYLDSEGGGTDKNFVQFIGADPNKILYSPIDTMDELKIKMGKVIDLVEKNKSAKKILLAIDSMSMISTAKEMDEAKGSDYGAKAKQVREYFRIYSRKIQKLNICMLMTAHYTQRLDAYGPPKVIGGGTIMAFAPSLMIELTHNTSESEIEKTAIGASIVGLKARIGKSRLGTFGKQMEFEFDMNRGLDAYSGLFGILKDYKIIIPAQKEFEKQIKEKHIPKKSTGAWTFNPWEQTDLFEDFKKKVRDSGKFREKEFNGFCAQSEKWIIDKFQTALDKATFVEEPTIEKLDKEVEILAESKDSPPKPKPSGIRQIKEGAEKPTPPKGRIITEGIDPRKQDIDGNKIKKKK